MPSVININCTYSVDSGKEVKRKVKCKFLYKKGKVVEEIPEA